MLSGICSFLILGAFFFFLSVQGVVERNSLGIPLAGEQIDTHKYAQRHYEEHPDGTHTKFSYDVEVVQNLVNLELDELVENVDCTLETLTIQVKDGYNPNWNEKTTFVGSSKLGCADKDGKVAPFYRGVQSIDMKGNTLFVKTFVKSLVECFQSAKVDLHRQPPKNQKRIHYFGPADNTETLTLFGWNYNSGSQSAEKSLPIFNVDGVSASCSNCYASLNAGLEWSLYVDSNWGLPKLEHLKLVAFGDATINVEGTATASYSINFEKQVTILGEVNLGHIDFLLGSVPVQITPSVSMDAKADVRASASGSVTTGFKYDEHISVGIEYKDDWGEFRTIPFQASNSFTVSQPTFSINAAADVRLTLLPRLTLKLYGIAPFYAVVEPYIGAKLKAGTSSSCTDITDVHYELYGGIDGLIGLDKLTFDFLGFDFSVGKSVGLPADRTFTIIDEEDLSCSHCVGCLDLSRNPSDQSYHWSFSEWEACSQECGGGSKTRNVSCVQRNTVVDDSLCAGLPKPDSVASCNENPCINCTENTDCHTCNENIHCGWCSEQLTCMYRKESVCPSSLQLYQCDTKENPISIVRFSPTNITEGSRITIEWTGGNDDVFIVYRWRVDMDWLAAGVNSNSYSNNGTFSFMLPSGTPLGTYEFAVVSRTDKVNYDIVTGIDIISNTNSNFWGHYGWTRCSEECTVGVQTRMSQCFDSNGDSVDASACPGSPEEHSRECTTNYACKSFPLYARSPVSGQEITARTNIEWSGGAQNENVVFVIRTYDIDNGFHGEWQPVTKAPNNGSIEFDPSVHSFGFNWYQLNYTSEQNPDNSVLTGPFIIKLEEESGASWLQTSFFFCAFFTFAVLFLQNKSNVK